MKRIYIAGAALALLSLSACASIGTAPLTPVNLQVPLAQGETGLEASYNIAANAFLARAPTMDPALKASLKSILAKAYAATEAAAAAETLGNASNLQEQIDAATTLIRQAKGLLGI